MVYTGENVRLFCPVATTTAVQLLLPLLPHHDMGEDKTESYSHLILSVYFLLCLFHVCLSMCVYVCTSFHVPLQGFHILFSKAIGTNSCVGWL